MAIPTLFASFAALPLAQFGEPIEITQLLPEPSELLSADLNGDGILDVVGTSNADDLLRVWFGDGMGDYRRGEVLDVRIQSVSSMSAGDLDRDGDVDLAFAVLGPAVLWIENLGGGVFAPEVPLAGFGAPAPDSQVRLRVQDVDGDGWSDVLMSFDRSSAAQDSLVILATNLGAGSFDVQPILSSVEPLYDVEAADLDGDGDMDIAVGNRGPLVWYRNDFGIWSAPIAIGPNNDPGDEEITILDFDSDGDLDVLAMEGSGTLRLRAILGDGAGGFAISDLGFSPANVTDVRVCDLSGDGLPDIACGQRGSISNGLLWVALGQGGGAMASFDLLDAWRSPIGAIEVLDGDADGTPEILVGLSAGAVIGREIDPSSPALAFAPGTTELTESTTSSASYIRRISSVDLNGDGLDDLLLNGRVERRAGWRPASGGGGFGDLQPLAFSEARVDVALAGDFDGDGIIDVLLRSSDAAATSLRRGTGFGSFAPAAALIGLPPSFDVGAADDINGDGLADLIKRSPAFPQAFEWAPNLGGGAFGPLRSRSLGAATLNGPELVDATGDGVRDLTLLTTDGQGLNAALRIFPGTGSGDFAAIPIEAPLFAPFEYSTTSGFRLVDLDADALPDLIVSVNSRFSPFRSRLMVYRGLGQGQFGPVQVVAGTAQHARDLEVVDIDLDGQADLVFHQPFRPGELSGLLWKRGISATQFAPSQPIVESTASTSQWALGDYDGDGDLDAVYGKRFDPPIHRVENLTREVIGSAYCESSVPNSTGQVGILGVIGSGDPMANDLTLVARRLPAQTFGLFLTSQVKDASSVPNSIGVLCLGGFIGRFVGQGQVLSSGADGVVTLAVSPLGLPGQGGPTAAMAGESWHFQAWHRDTAQGQATSNFTQATTVSFE